MDEEEKIYRQKVFKIGAISIGICLLIAYCYATQGMAAECGYSKILGNCLSIGDLKIYPPYKYYFWQQDIELQKAIPQKNPLKEIYGEYVQNLRPFARIFKGKKIKNLEDVRRETLELMKNKKSIGRRTKMRQVRFIFC